jgi:hypothetical protein
MTIDSDISFSQTLPAGQPTVLHQTNGTGFVTYNGAIDMETDQIFAIETPGDVNFNGPVSGPAHLTLTISTGSPAAATYHLSNTSNSFSGGLEVDHAILSIEARNAIPSAGPIAVGAAGVLRVGSSTHSIESFSCDNGGTLDIDGGFGQLNVAGQVTLGNCLLQITGPTPGAGTLIQSTKPIIGQFAKLPEGAILGGLILTYHGGTSGNDIVLMTPPPAVTFVQDLWWAGALENGWGMSIIQHGDRVFVAMYIYDANGNPTWLALLGGAWNSAHTAFSGPLYSPTGSPFYAYDASHFSAGTAKGTITINFQDSSHATIDYTVGSTTGHKVIARQSFGSGTMVGVDHTDLWWGGMSQNGWGLTIMQQGATLFPIWFTYGPSGSPLWYFMDGAWNAANDTYTGTLYRATGSAWLGVPYDASKLNVIKAGNFTLVFTGANATFNYSADGHTGTLSLSRQPF